MPCSDELENQDSINHATSTVAHEKDDCNTESCTSICLCTCCGQSVVETQFVVFELEIPILELERKMTRHQFSLLQQTHHIWQPPKLIVNG